MGQGSVTRSERGDRVHPWGSFPRASRGSGISLQRETLLLKAGHFLPSLPLKASRPPSFRPTQIQSNLVIKQRLAETGVAEERACQKT